MNINFLFLAVIALAIIGGLANTAKADPVEIELGRANMPPCSRVTWSQGALLIPSPTVETAEQVVSAYAIVDMNSSIDDDIHNVVNECAAQAAALVGIANIIASPANAMTAFQQSFDGCMISRSKTYKSLQLRLSDAKCMWVNP